MSHSRARAVTAENDRATRQALLAWADRHRPARRRRVARPIALVAVGATLGAGLSTAAFALDIVPFALTPSASPSAETDYPQLAVFDQLAEVPGFISGGIDPQDENGLEIYWHGAPSAGAQQIIDDARANGVDVRIIQVARTTEEIWQAALDLVEALEAQDIEVWGFGPNRLNTTIELMGPQLSVSPELQAKALKIATETIGGGYNVVFLPNETGMEF